MVTAGCTILSEEDFVSIKDETVGVLDTLGKKT